MTTKLIVATHRGSGLATVQDIIEGLGAELQVVSTVAEARVGLMDRLILLGGADVAPFWYGEEEMGSREPDKRRDLIEWTLIRRALSEDIPTLGICRGQQMMAVAAGGSLHQDIDGHEGKRHELTRVHPALETRLHTHAVNSYHHQAVRTMPLGFRIGALSPDGIVESLYRPGYVGVQFHPEFMYPTDHRWVSLFRWLLDGLDLPMPTNEPRPVARRA